MSGLDANVRDYFDPSVQGPTYIAPITETEEAQQNKGTDSGDSSIEKSKSVVVPYIPLSNLPTLAPPSGEDEFSKVIGSIAIDGPDHSRIDAFILSQDLKMSEIMDQMLDAWTKSIHEQQEYIRRMINDPMYQELLRIRITGGDTQANVSGIQSVTSASLAGINPSAANLAPDNVVSTLDRLNAFEKIPPTATIPDPNDPKDPSKMLVVPLVAAMIAGGALALVDVELATTINSVNSTPMAGTMEIVERLQPLFPQPQLLAEMIPMINLMVMPLIYSSSWDAAIGGLRNKEGENNKAAIQDFAQQVIKMVSDPSFVLVTIVNKMDGASQLSPERKDQLVAIIKLILASVALSLLYSFDVGKVQGNQFWGMEPQEFKALLSGEMEIPGSDDPNLNPIDKLPITLLSLVRSQLDALPAADKENAINILFDYLGENKGVQDLLDPSKTFNAVVKHLQFNAAANGLETSQA